MGNSSLERICNSLMLDGSQRIMSLEPIHSCGSGPIVNGTLWLDYFCKACPRVGLNPLTRVHMERDRHRCSEWNAQKLREKPETESNRVQRRKQRLTDDTMYLPIWQKSPGSPTADLWGESIARRCLDLDSFLSFTTVSLQVNKLPLEKPTHLGKYCFHQPRLTKTGSNDSELRFFQYCRKSVEYPQGFFFLSYWRFTDPLPPKDNIPPPANWWHYILEKKTMKNQSLTYLK